MNADILKRFEPDKNSMDEIVKHVAGFIVGKKPDKDDNKEVPELKREIPEPTRENSIEEFHAILGSLGVSAEIKYTAACSRCGDEVEIDEEYVLDRSDMTYCGRDQRCCP